MFGSHAVKNRAMLPLGKHDPVFWADATMGNTMDVSSIAATATAMADLQVQAQLGVSVLKKAIDLQSAGALQLVQAVATPAPVVAQAGGVDTWA
ncbi:hypothetical protein AGMMS49960_18520 [Betaproteobacteria bacterium]|nr:hypothetical protein AGMMS49543_17810 [Betaproteobacteria bacterium]GHU03740.1 hypothetical protein AGMMS49960_18520 [Betaproteobacteria bacterium]GHU21825.1 hypothetical protein AGMMS50243_20250 [Betaproteobacteria bacterium]